MSDINPFTEITDHLKKIDKKVSEISDLIALQKNNNEVGVAVLPTTGGIELAVRITGYKPSTIYKMSSRGSIPCLKPTKGKLIFVSKDLLEWISGNKMIIPTKIVDFKSKKK